MSNSEPLRVRARDVSARAGDASASAPVPLPTAAAQSFKVKVIADGCEDWVGNNVRLRTRLEAEAYAPNYANRCLDVRHWRVMRSDEPPNYSYADGELTHL